MRITPKGFLRGATLLVILLCGTAIWIGRLEPTAAPYRVRGARELVGINAYCFSAYERTTRLLDPSSGKIVRLNLPNKDILDFAAVSPWQDEDGKSIVVGRWINRLLDAGPSPGCGLARYTIPDGRILDRLAVDIVPSSRPCFFPDNPHRILFAAADGQLYRLQFAGDRDRDDIKDKEELRPQRLEWGVTPPGSGLIIADPVWPAVRGLKQRILATVSYLQRGDHSKFYTPSQLWWFDLSQDGRTIIGAGRLSNRPEPNVRRREYRLPNLASTADGELILAYQTRKSRAEGWTLELARIKVDAGTGDLKIGQKANRAALDECLPSLPVFSPDRRWVYVLQKADHELVRRVSVGRTLGLPESRVAGLALAPAKGSW